MATTRGCGGVFWIFGTPVAELRDWSFEETAEQLDVTALGTCEKKFDTGAEQATATITMWWDPGDVAQGLIRRGQPNSLRTYSGFTRTAPAPEKRYYSFPACVVVSKTMEAGGADGTVGMVWNFALNGPTTAGVD